VQDEEDEEEETPMSGGLYAEDMPMMSRKG
jgi:hypothetical protein